jgi:predicted RNA-binding protein with PUA-like domain
MRHWLMKSEPDEFGIDDLAKSPRQTAPWTGVRNFTARNFMRYEMQIGDPIFFWHSSTDPIGIAGIAEVASAPHVDESQFDPKSDYYDERSKREKPRWWCVDVKFVRKTPFVRMDELRKHKALADMIVLRRGNRLSITPFEPAEWGYIEKKLLGG